jgi:uncharacterized protein (TIGR02284 family)
MSMSRKTAQLNELIEVTRDGERFYQHALGEVKDADLRRLFEDMLQAKLRIIQALAVEVAGEQQPPAQGGTLLGKLRELYADTRGALSRDADATYLEQLAAAEQRILEAFEDAMADAEPDLRALLSVEMPNLRAGHDRLQQYKGLQQ